MLWSYPFFNCVDPDSDNGRYKLRSNQCLNDSCSGTKNVTLFTKLFFSQHGIATEKYAKTLCLHWDLNRKPAQKYQFKNVIKT